jgi:DNA helicase II / ATP-dependent DNA helicase PcrA
MLSATHPLLKDLNEAQRLAVAAPDTNMLVLAGAGSGKTRVLTHRIAWLMQDKGVPTHSILAVTFTNKAAGEMRERLERMNIPMQGMWVGTFHGLCHRWLRAHYEEAGLPEAFQVLDSDDQARLIKRVMVDLQVDPDVHKPRKVAEWINGRKDQALRAYAIKPQTADEQTYHDVFVAYEERCQIAGLVDFAEIMLRTHELFDTQPDILAKYQARFTHLLVDEFQDTNTLQYALVRQLAGKTGHVLVVGDDSQAIYGWRGARVDNIHRFLKDFLNAQLYRLEQNYRSFPAVLKAANALIANNSSQLDKKLWTDRTETDKIHLYTALSEQDEAQFVVDEVRRWIKEGGKPEDCAVLYRSNAQSRPLEEALIAARQAYKITGGLRFFDRAEIKDAMAYLRLAMSSQDDAAFERVANVPTRGMGEKSLAAIRDHARIHRQDFWTTSQQLLASGDLPKRTQTALRDFLDTVDQVRTAVSASGVALSEGVEQMLVITALREYHGKEGAGEVDKNRVENLDELVSVAGRFSPLEGAPANPLLAFLTHAALEAGEAAAQEDEPSVELMTLHAAKGLEFPCVFIVGLEDGLFPSERVLADPDPSRLEEERRLAYVGITRAEQRLFLTHAHQRRLYGGFSMNPVSRFVQELPRDVLNASSSKGQHTSLPLPANSRGAQRAAMRPAIPLPTTAGTPWRPGSTVMHTTYGQGLVVKLDAQDAVVAFRQAGVKRVAVSELQSP